MSTGLEYQSPRENDLSDHEHTPENRIWRLVRGEPEVPLCLASFDGHQVGAPGTWHDEDMVGVVVLAAGGSRRLGRPKQLVPWEGETLLRRAVRTAQDCGCGPVMVVLGYQAEQMLQELEDLDVESVICDEWELGMGRSLACGIEALVQVRPALEAAIVMTCDQPEVSPEVLLQLAGKWREGCPVSACTYDDTVGVPALFDAALFVDLSRLSGDQGAKSVLQAHKNQLGLVPFAGGSRDIDLPTDLV